MYFIAKKASAGRVYGILGNYPPGVDPDDNLVPIEFVSSFLWENGSFSEFDILLPGGIPSGVRQDGVVWGSNANDAFIQDGTNLTILDLPDYEHTGIRAMTSQGEAFGFGLNINEGSIDSTRFFWDPVAGFQDWPAGATLPGTDQQPADLNEAGVFWGFSAANTAFVATPIPEPGIALLVGVGLIGLVLDGRRQSDSVRSTGPS